MAKVAVQSVVEPDQDVGADQSSHEKAEVIIRKYVKIAAGAGLVPVPVWDIAAIFGVHVALVKELGQNPFG